MATPEHILNRVKLLINLSNSPVQGEADNAREAVAKLVAKYNITDEELKSLEDKKPLYGDDDKLFVTFGRVNWKQTLALTIAKQFYCQIVQEELVPVEGLHQYTYYVYGDLEDADNVKFVYNTFSNRIEELVAEKCIGRGPMYVASYTEGLVEAINNNIMWEGIDLPDIKVPSRKEPASVPERTLNNGTANLEVKREEKEKPCQETVAPGGGGLIKDIGAYYKGMQDGRDFSLQDVLELAAKNREVDQLTESSEDNDNQTNSP